MRVEKASETNEFRGEDRFSRASNARDKGRRLLMPGHMLRVTLSAKMKDLQLGWSWVVAVSVKVDLTAVPLRVSFVLVVCICFSIRGVFAVP